MATISQRQDSAFYHSGIAGYEIVWEQRGKPWYVVRNGEMRIELAGREPENRYIITSTEQLESHGIRNDEQLYQAERDAGFDWVCNSWYEVWADGAEFDEDGEVYHFLDDAIEIANIRNKGKNK